MTVYSKNIRISDVTLFLYLFTQFCYLFGGSTDTNVCRVTFLVYVLTAVATDVRSEIRKTGNFALPKITIVVTLFWAYCFASTLWSPDVRAAFNITYLNNAIHIVVLAVLLPCRFKTKKDLDLLIDIYILLMLAVLLALLIKTPSSAWGTERVGAAIGLNENSVGIMFAVAILFVMHRALQNKKWILLLLCVPFVIVSLMTGSRKAFFIIPFLVIAYLAGSTRGFKGIFTVAVSFLFVGGLFWAVMNVQELYDVIGDRLQQTFNEMNGMQSDLDVMRNFYRAYGWELFLQRPFFGYGMSGFQLMLMGAVSSEAAYSHCNYIELLSCYGLVGFVLFYSIYLGIVRRVFRNKRLSAQTKSLVIVLLAALVILDYGNVSYPEIITYLYLIFASILVRNGEGKYNEVLNHEGK